MVCDHILFSLREILWITYISYLREYNYIFITVVVITITSTTLWNFPKQEQVRYTYTKKIITNKRLCHLHSRKHESYNMPCFFLRLKFSLSQVSFNTHRCLGTVDISCLYSFLVIQHKTAFKLALLPTFRFKTVPSRHVKLKSNVTGMNQRCVHLAFISKGQW